MDPFRGTSQPCLGSLVESLKNTERVSSLNIEEVRDISNYWQTVRKQYIAFDEGVIFLHQKYIYMECQVDSSQIY